jgi:antitoxin CptB
MEPSIYASPGCVRAFGVVLAMTERSSAGLDGRRRKLLFRAWRRGVREMDLIVGRFADVHIEALDAAGLDDFERLMEAPNAELYAWVTGAASAPPRYDTAVLASLRQFHTRKMQKQRGAER